MIYSRADDLHRGLVHPRDFEQVRPHLDDVTNFQEFSLSGFDVCAVLTTSVLNVKLVPLLPYSGVTRWYSLFSDHHVACAASSHNHFFVFQFVKAAENFLGVFKWPDNQINSFRRVRILLCFRGARWWNAGCFDHFRLKIFGSSALGGNIMLILLERLLEPFH